MNDQPARQKFIEMLEKQAAIAEQLMDDARLQLNEHDDQDGYRKKLEQRTELILTLPEKLGPLTGCLSTGDCDLVERWVGELAEDAGHARRLDSIFYMSILLYDGPDDEKPINDIARLAAKLRQG